ncbi:stage II sporulation protein M [Candidatus Micrarchaeota archaeon]|nr:stage II sporulation protein M [Candidatus Micrarchaeota archaeon]
MIESILSPSSVERKPWEAFIAGFVFTIASAFIALQIGTASPSQSGLGFLTVAFINIAAAPFFLNLFRIEERKREGNLFQRHAPIIEVFGYFFIAVILASSIVFVVLPADTRFALYADQIHDLQSKQIISSAQVTGQATGFAALPGLDFFSIFSNNMKVLALAFIFSFIFGTGAIFLISWNATILGVLVGKIAENPGAFGSVVVVPGNIVANYLIALPLTLLRLIPHGLFEFGGYFFAAVAGGILSVAIIQERFMRERARVLKDSLAYLAIGAALILVGAVVEVSV